ncbi:hypothetical protein HK099_002432 [Clydaea vesicula]|uniref:Uncharacterized protein n=1 Tax=Clydaea vesicula TaxID=447962 RepID=A0AAD5UAD8_9FUNG|nr:hypothetical protein HK099_002432 [Clydaea vesicula]
MKFPLYLVITAILTYVSSSHLSSSSLDTTQTKDHPKLFNLKNISGEGRVKRSLKIANDNISGEGRVKRRLRVSKDNISGEGRVKRSLNVVNDNISGEGRVKRSLNTASGNISGEGKNN